MVVLKFSGTGARVIDIPCAWKAWAFFLLKKERKIASNLLYCECLETDTGNAEEQPVRDISNHTAYINILC